MTNRAILLLSLTLPLAACGSKPAVDETNASVEEVAKKVGQAAKGENFIRPGKWQSKMTIDQMTMPGMPPEAAEQMKKMMAHNQMTESCVTPEEVRQPKPNLFGGNDQCRYDRFTMGNGKIDAEMHCSQQGTTQAMQMSGTYSADSYRMHMKSRTEGVGAGEGVSMEMTIDAKRIGECSGKEA